MKGLASFVKEKRKLAGLTQEEFAEHTGVALTVIRKIEQGKDTLNMSSVNQVLFMFGSILAPVSKREIETQAT
ncbi:helix-turn-helix domain-containing protein [Pedobacter borealis]|uniref:helix-turn-helix domain-containing protein n=1 Tax=Pedobacter borealis TaxID=475254 RepID=UPI00049354C2|nr:helix-turn-helix domain-containing protein [Pedobacter borealis]